MIYKDHVVKCCVIPCDKEASYGAIEDGDLHEWNYYCKVHRDELGPELQIRLIEHCPPFCDELTAKIPQGLDPDMPAEELRLHMGELTANEVRVARAAIRWANSRVKP